MDIKVKDNRISLVRFLDICTGDSFIYDNAVCIKTNGFRTDDNSPIENFYNSIDINGNFHYFVPATLVNPIKKVIFTIEE